MLFRSVKQSSGIGATQSMQSRLAGTMTDIVDDQQWVVEEDLLRFRLADVMLFDALAAVAYVPIKPLDPRKIKHNVYYHNIHK